jgi:hypothetical protein
MRTVLLPAVAEPVIFVSVRLPRGIGTRQAIEIVVRVRPIPIRAVVRAKKQP